MNLLSAKNLSHSFDYELFHNVSLDLNTKESIAIIGISGSGKSTLLHLLSTLLKPDSGEVELLGEDVLSMKEKKLSLLRRNELGLVFQSHYLFKGFSAYENLEVSEILAQEKIDKQLLQRLDIEHWALYTSKDHRTLRRATATCLYCKSSDKKADDYLCR